MSRVPASVRKRAKHHRRMRDSTKEKILLVLATGAVLGLSHSNNSWRVIGHAAKAWKDIERRELVRALKEFRHARMLSWEEHDDTSVTITLTERGKLRALRQRFDSMVIPMPKHWDGRWRFVLFDIPEKSRLKRNIFRNKLQELGFKKVQQSLWVIPYPCKDEVDFIVEFLELRHYVRFLETITLSNDEDLRLHFKI